MHFKKSLLILSISLMVLLAACNGQSTEEQIHNHLEEAVTLEEEFEKQQREITDLELEEQDIYDQIIDLGMDDIETIQELSNQALKIIEQRVEKIGLEKDSIESSKEEFNQIEALLTDIENEGLKDTAESMYEVMNNRYSAYEELNDAYMKSLELEQELYEILQQEDLEQETLTEQINSINESYEQVLQHNEAFNNYTVEYNELKKEFYEAADLTVSFEE
ncbi:YkyA family protein [Oceanobacillus polygoni]|uniref:NAD+--asparagine ADP-ribosyltransferase n=1 Tax=Oceanobacillus polygoni TaxID=1235259 RepID=A0A9X0YVT9_9BACI|nr:YkyA family protein [Oceanobacillus polygoni]MBP2077911.1 NAD+--asparagine ADP-ribosyltransferase [Oceanobacillus polygoni]